MLSWSPSGLKAAPYLEWGSHVAHFFRSADELRDVLVPYFKAGLQNNERCLWVTGEPFGVEQAREALREAVPDLDERERDGQIEIASGADWYDAGADVVPETLVEGLLQREREALALGYAGLRTNGNCAWVTERQWNDFLDYETLVHANVPERRFICMCSYALDELDGPAQTEIMERHHLLVPAAVPSGPAGESPH